MGCFGADSGWRICPPPSFIPKGGSTTFYRIFVLYKKSQKLNLFAFIFLILQPTKVSIILLEFQKVRNFVIEKSVSSIKIGMKN